MRIALATCADVKEPPDDDRPLHAAFAQVSVECSMVVWNDAAVDWSRYHGCLIRSTWDYARRRGEFLAWIDAAAARIPLFNPPAVIRWNTHKSYLLDLERRGVPVIPTAWLPRGRPVDAGHLLAGRGWPRAVLKPAVGASARETIRVDDSTAGLARARAHLDRLLETEDMLVQPYLDAVEREGELSAVFIDGELTHAVRKLPRPGDYRVQEELGGGAEPVELAAAQRELAEGVIAAAGRPLLYARVDLLPGPDGALRLLELEAVEPSLFFEQGPHAAARLAAALVARLDGGRG